MLSENKTITILSILAAVLFVFAFFMVIFYAPIEVNMGLVQKVFYFHMSAAWVGMLAFLMAAVFGILYLVHKDLKWDRLIASSVEIGLLFTVICILSGMIWARPIWNTWWTWDPRLTTVTIMAFTYIAFILLRRSMDEPSKRAQFSAIYAIIGFVTVPFTFFSARLLRTIHPVIFGSGEVDMNLNQPMLTTMFISLGAFTVVYVALLLQRERLMQAEEALMRLRLQTEIDADWEDQADA